MYWVSWGVSWQRYEKVVNTSMEFGLEERPTLVRWAAQHVTKIL